MTQSEAAQGSDKVPNELIQLGDYQWPRSEARQTLGHLFEKIRTSVLPNLDKDAVDTRKLTAVSDEPFKNRVCDRLSEIFDDMLDQHYLDWASAAQDPDLRRALVYPPMHDDPLLLWAERHGFPTLQADQRLDDLAQADFIVIPGLEQFFRRDHKGLTPLLDLFSDLAGSNIRVLVGCNSWAWRYLKQFDDALLLFGRADTFPAFDADALAALLESAHCDDDQLSNFTSVSSGDPILARKDDQSLKDPYLEELAGRSLGHAYVAVEMFFRGIAETKDSEDDTPAQRTWIDLPAPCSLPTSGAGMMLFALHALMIHGSRKVSELNKLLPQRVPNGVWTELDRIGLIELHDGQARCAVRSYPDARNELGAAGFNLDRL